MRGGKGIDPSGLAMSVRGFPEICYLNGLDVFFFFFNDKKNHSSPSLNIYYGPFHCINSFSEGESRSVV